MNFKIQPDPVAILQTGAAIDNATVFGSLKMARAALSDAIDNHIIVLRAARKVAIRVREADLPSDETIPVSGPPAASIAVEAPDPQVPAEEVEQAGAASDDLLAVPAFLRRAGV